MSVFSSIKFATLGLLVSYLSGVVRGLDVPPAGGLGSGLAGGAGDKPLPGVGGNGGLGETVQGLGIDQILNLDLDNQKKLVGVGGQQGEAKIDVLAAKRAKENNSTAEEEKQKIKDNQKNDKDTKRKAEEDLIAGRLNAFYAYGMQSVGQNVRPKWVLVFENAFTAHAYFGQVMQDYQEYYKKSRENSKDPRPHPQIFIFPHGVGPDGLERVKKYKDYANKLFFNPVDEKTMQLPVIPVQDKYGYVLHSTG
ncbi:hypothetical protein PEX1_084280 [Penicillium expansum]|uniref:Uncharacterized protein n=1 Tax=Penicillium expansum TaxID=27334 RepID=A0A0A2ITH5_PENEN|nr:hypothetical protein PEX2_040740 [Penicillium expansum]KAJ5510960.1 hypothetical protein N7453_003063 [Penicillium expansum]KGO45786.1 hypothetical protein PEXP_019090 [Penicillium expansum]KGO57944.1 hypothetical protein PEX2_040740 [Penicillium expansum]KGO68374.1 hypothetical protein PEX1_084280 [Penicillium expansum]